MVVWIKVGDRSDRGVLVDGLWLMRVAIGGLVGHIVDTVGFVRLAVGVHHGGISSPAREAFFLAVPLFVAVSADNVGVGSGVVTGLAVVASRAGVDPGLESAIAGPKCSDLFDLLLGQFFPDDLSGFFWLKFGFYGGNLVEPLVVVLDGLQVAGHFHALIESGLFSLQNFVADAIFKSGKKQLMLDKLEGVRDAFGFGLGDGGSNGSDGSHGGGLIVSQAFVGCLDPIGVVVDGILGFLV
jgi:hypothetical protein